MRAAAVVIADVLGWLCGVDSSRQTVVMVVNTHALLLVSHTQAGTSLVDILIGLRWVSFYAYGVCIAFA